MQSELMQADLSEEMEEELEEQLRTAQERSQQLAEAAAELQQAREHVARLQQTVAERDRALQRLSAAHDDDVRRQIALQEQINKMASVRSSDEHGDTLRLETTRLRETAQQREEEVGKLQQELGAAQRTIATMQAERQQRRDT